MKNPATIKLTIKTKDNIGALERISNIFTSLNINILKTSAKISPITRQFTCSVTIQLNNWEGILKLMEENEEIKNQIKLVDKKAEND